MVLDAVSNFVRGTADAQLTAGATTLSVADASIFPDPSVDGEYNVVIWDVGNFPRPDQDGDVEILRVTARDTTADEVTVVRAQETTAAAAHPSGSAVHLSPTAKMFGDIESTFADFWDSATQELTADVNNQSVTTESINTGGIQIGSEYKWASNYPGSTPDERLSNVIDDSNDGDVLFLEQARYTGEHTINSRVRVIGTGGIQDQGSQIENTMTLTDSVYINGLTFTKSRVDNGANNLVINERFCKVESCYSRDGEEIVVNADRTLIYGHHRGNVIFGSDTTEGMVDASVTVTVTDNGTNTVGDIS